MKCECNNCEWTGDETDLRADLSETEDLLQRVDPGDEMPAGECPECGCLAFIVDDTKPTPLKGKPNYFALHHHCYGVSVYLIRCDRTPTPEEVIETCNLDFEEDKAEWIDIEAIGPGDEVHVIEAKATNPTA